MCRHKQALAAQKLECAQKLQQAATQQVSNLVLCKADK